MRDPMLAAPQNCHCEERSDEAISPMLRLLRSGRGPSLAMTADRRSQQRFKIPRMSNTGGDI